jgi:hypothetical protein
MASDNYLSVLTCPANKESLLLYIWCWNQIPFPKFLLGKLTAIDIVQNNSRLMFIIYGTTGLYNNSWASLIPVAQVMGLPCNCFLSNCLDSFSSRMGFIPCFNCKTWKSVVVCSLVRKLRKGEGYCFYCNWWHFRLRVCSFPPVTSILRVMWKQWNTAKEFMKVLWLVNSLLLCDKIFPFQYECDIFMLNQYTKKVYMNPYFRSIEILVFVEKYKLC